MPTLRPLPTLLGLVVAILGLLFLMASRVPAPEPPPSVMLEPLPTVPFTAVLFRATGSEVRSREVRLGARDAPDAKLEASLRALKAWLADTWPADLGAPQVFWLGEGRAALDFALRGTPQVSVATELQLLESIRQTAARQGATDVFILVNDEVPATFLGQVVLPQVLD